jgi:4-hydroxy-3-polyprenylbenzoate decarboxylase
MAFANLREFVAHLEKQGALRRVTAPVSRDLEIAEITDRVSKGAAGRNQALLFENVQGFQMPVLINAFGSPERMAAALGVAHLD